MADLEFQNYTASPVIYFLKGIVLALQVGSDHFMIGTLLKFHAN